MRITRFVLVGASVAGLTSQLAGPAWAAGTLHVSVATGLVQKQSVTVTGNGFASGSYGYVLECNATPGEPTVAVGPPFDQALPVGCTAPSLKHLVSTTATGGLTTTFQIKLNKRLGPPCGSSNVTGPCSRYDSAGQHPRRDARNFPCPPTPAQSASGVTCVLVFYDSANDVASTPIAFGASKR